ncbi:integrase [Bosea sp. BE271]|uniref:tyrosine-type recombinase/integrase n=1 Tax=Bosea TaxID=85413 RepID=UPI002862AE34|nr:MULTISPECIES: tyrosine-type recombinase/integrase [Bosea]MDR6829809.1 integrase [Bosea robiniae]MDR6896692.1 integrase [Bosea sp. BE109]MDR7140090.1 integrase [Bosea sp. BE168]MDR7176596.1 integrase [Bosea sp. BE271]
MSFRIAAYLRFGVVLSLKHLTRLVTRALPEPVHISNDGFTVDILPRFTRWLRQQGLAAATVARYELAAARFIDFLVEVEVFGRECAIGRRADAIEVYPLFLRDGAAISHPEFPSLPHYAREIGAVRGLSANATQPTIAAVNRMLRFAKDDADRTRALLANVGHQVDFLELGETFRAIDGVVAWSRLEKEHFKQRSVLGGVIRIKSALTRPRGLRSAIRSGKQVESEARDFPLQWLSNLLEAATSHRDRALWALLAGGGLRLHEALNIRTNELDLRTREIFVIDPERRRFARALSRTENERFKGRQVSRVTMFEPVASFFWDALEQYLRKEFVPVDNDDHLFQQLEATRRGRPLSAASDAALQSSFKKAVKAVGVPGPPDDPKHVWTPHSLRHLYGVYMLNYVPVPGGPGLRLTEVQQLMGHARIESTRVYARHDRILLEAKVAVAEWAVFEGRSPQEALSALPELIATRLRNAADVLEKQ